jgi:uncharacterized protein YecE (DUF72 family)
MPNDWKNTAHSPYSGKNYMRDEKNIHVGTSDLHCGDWLGAFYPEKFYKKGFLAYDAEYFDTVKINNSFYRLPKRKTLLSWRKTVPAKFFFAIKMSRFITHMKKLRTVEKVLYAFLNRIRLLGDKVGPVLFQLPPRWCFNLERFQNFLEILLSGYRYAFEFRDGTWNLPKRDTIFYGRNE